MALVREVPGLVLRQAEAVKAELAGIPDRCVELGAGIPLDAADRRLLKEIERRAFKGLAYVEALVSDVAAGEPGFEVPPPPPPPPPAAPAVLRLHKGRIVVTKPGEVLHDVEAPDGIEVRADRVKVRRALVAGCDGSRAVETAPDTAGAQFEFVTVRRHVGAAFYLAGAGAVVYRAHVLDQRDGGAEQEDGETLGCSILSGTGKGSSAKPLANHILECRLERLAHHQGVELKSARNLVELVTAIGGGRRVSLFTRHGPENTFRDCYVVNGHVWLADERGRAEGCVTTGELHHPCLGIAAGTLSGRELREERRKGHPYAEGAVVDGHTGRVVVGFDPNSIARPGGGGWGRMPKGTLLRGVEAAKLATVGGGWQGMGGEARKSRAREVLAREVGHDGR